MKRKKVLLGLACFIAMNTGNYAFASDNPFASVPHTTGYYEDLASLIHDGLVDGYADTDFNEARPLTRVEMAVFTAKAMSNSQNATVEDQAKLKKLEMEFQSELTDMHVKVPGVLPKENTSAATSAQKPSPLQLGGEVRVRYDHYADHTPKRGTYNKSTVKDTSYWLELDGNANLGSGWAAKFRIGGAKDLNGQDRGGQENTNGDFDILRAYAVGPLGAGTLQVGRDKSQGDFDLVMGEYWQGLKYSANAKKVHFDVIYGKPDYLSSTRDTAGENAINYYNPKTGTYTWKDDRGVNATVINPADTGINFFSVDAKYPITDKWDIGGAYWRTMSSVSGYQDTNIYELLSNYQLTSKLSNTLEYSRSSRDKDNKAYTIGFKYGQEDKKVKGSNSWELDFVHLEAASYIKSTYDIKDNTVGREGWQLIYKYVPSKNILWMTRFLHARDLNGVGNSKVTENWFRTQVEFFF
jgi:hypothetical protein